MEKYIYYDESDPWPGLIIQRRGENGKIWSYWLKDQKDGKVIYELEDDDEEEK